MTGSASLAAGPTRPRSNEPTLDQLLAEPIVQQLMCRDRIDEATIRHLLQETAAARPAVWAEDDLDTNDPRSIVRLLHETARLWCSRYDREVRAQLPGMTRARCTVLIHLAQHEGGQSGRTSQNSRDQANNTRSPARPLGSGRLRYARAYP
jgi:hypothetical protein